MAKPIHTGNICYWRPEPKLTLLIPTTENSQYECRPLWTFKGRARGDAGPAVPLGPDCSPRLRRRAGRASRSGYRGSSPTYGPANATPDAGTGRQSHSNSNPHGYHDGRPNQHPSPPAVAHAHSNLYPDTNSDSGTHSYSHAATHCDPGTGTYGYTHAHCDTVAYPSTDP